MPPGHFCRVRSALDTVQAEHNSVMGLCVCVLSHVPLLATPWTVACEAPLSMKISRQEYWSGLPFPSPEDLPNPGIKPMSHVAGSGRLILYH